MNRYSLTLTILITPLFLSLFGCSTSDKVATAESQVEAQEFLSKAEQKQRDKQHQRNQEFMQDVPEWALKTKAPDQHGIYAVGIADAGSVQMALKKSKLQAEFGLAQAFQQEISGSERSVQEESSNHLSVNKYISVIDKLVERVPVVGAEVVDQELISSPSTGLFTSFVLLKLPYNEINRVLREQRNQSSDKKIQTYFDDLERRIDKRRTQRIEEEKIKQNLANETLKNRSELINNATQNQGAKSTDNIRAEGSDITDEVLSTLQE